MSTLFNKSYRDSDYIARNEHMQRHTCYDLPIFTCKNPIMGEGVVYESSLQYHLSVYCIRRINKSLTLCLDPLWIFKNQRHS